LEQTEAARVVGGNRRVIDGTCEAGKQCVVDRLMISCGAPPLPYREGWIDQSLGVVQVVANCLGHELVTFSKCAADNVPRGCGELDQIFCVRHRGSGLIWGFDLDGGTEMNPWELGGGPINQEIEDNYIEPTWSVMFDLTNGTCGYLQYTPGLQFKCPNPCEGPKRQLYMDKATPCEPNQ
jgi:hypothetical protein